MAQELATVPEPDTDDVGMEVDNPTGDEPSTGLLPTNFFQGKDLKPGSTCKIRIARVLDGQVEVEYVPHSEPEMGEEIPTGGDEEMTAYMES